MNQSNIQVYGSIIVSVLICIAFILGVYEANVHGDQHTIDMLNGALVGAFVTVVGFWIGSSMGSQKKDAMLFASQPPLTTTDSKIPPPKAV